MSDTIGSIVFMHSWLLSSSVVTCDSEENNSIPTNHAACDKYPAKINPRHAFGSNVMCTPFSFISNSCCI